MNTYTKTENIIDYTAMGLLSVCAILAAANIPYALTSFIFLWLASLVIFLITSIRSKIYKTSVLAFIIDLYCKMNMFAGIWFVSKGYAGKEMFGTYISALLVGYLIYDLIAKKIPVHRPVSYLLIYAITTGVCAA
ncbi:MAG: hypothetical protein IIT61_05235, partial [Bacteroidales bacterium]|nr:hypothetical protein [Bacteroidales bacterium]